MTAFNLSTEKKPTASELQALFAQTTWARERSLADIQALLSTMQLFVCVRSGEKLIGFGRAITDGIYRALIEDVVVDSRFRGKGVGRLIVSSLNEQLSSVEEVLLHTREQQVEFYRKQGFDVFQGKTMKRNK